MATLTVTPGQSIQAAINAAASGDTIDVQAGTYVDQFLTIRTSLTLQAVGGEVLMRETTQPPDGKAMITEGRLASNVAINGFDISGVSVPDHNGAAMRYEGGGLSCPTTISTATKRDFSAPQTQAAVSRLTTVNLRRMAMDQADAQHLRRRDRDLHAHRQLYPRRGCRARDQITSRRQHHHRQPHLRQRRERELQHRPAERRQRHDQRQHDRAGAQHPEPVHRGLRRRGRIQRRHQLCDRRQHHRQRRSVRPVPA